MISAADYLQARLDYEIDIQDVAAGLERNAFVLIDTRRRESWDHGHVPGAVHAPGGLLGDETAPLAPGTEVVVYGWGPGCNGATRAALVIAGHGYAVREMIGGFEYWCRTGLPVESANGPLRQRPDPLVIAT